MASKNDTTVTETPMRRDAPDMSFRAAVASGAALSLASRRVRNLLWVALISLIIDIVVAEILFQLGFATVSALSLSYLVAATFSYVVGAGSCRDEMFRATRQGISVEVFRFICIGLMGFGLRGGVFADAMKFLEWSPAASIVPGAIAAAIVGHLGGVFFVFRSVPRLNPENRWRLAALGAVAYILALRLAYAGLVNLLPEEAYYWNFSQHPDVGYLDHPPMSAWMIWLGTHVFGNTEFGVRIGAYLAWAAVTLFSYRLTTNLFDRAAARTGLVLSAVLPVFFYTGFLMTPDAPLTACWAGALYFLERALIADRRQAWWCVGICAGLGLVSKYTIALLGPAALIFVLIDPAARRWLRRTEPYLAAIVAAVLFSPVIYWNAVHGWASFAFQSTGRLAESSKFSTHELLAAATLLLTPLGLASVVAIFISRRQRLRLAPRGDLGAARRLLFMIVFTATPLFVFFAFSISHQVKFDWTSPVWLAILPAVAAMIARVPAEPRGFDWLKARFWAPGLVGTLAIYAVLLHYLVLGIPYVGNFGSVRALPVAWDEFGRQVGLIQQSVEKETGQGVLISGMDKYYAASEAAFYNRQTRDAVLTSVGSGPFGNESLMYGFWFKPTEMQGRTIVLFGVKRADVEQDHLDRYFSRLTDTRIQDIFKNGVLIGRLFYRIGYDYRDCLRAGSSCPPG